MSKGVTRTIGMEIEYLEALAGDIVPKLPKDWGWSIDPSLWHRDGSRPGRLHTERKLFVSNNTRGGEVKTNPYLVPPRLREKIQPVLDILRNANAEFGDVTGFQVHVKTKLPPAAASVKKVVTYIQAHGVYMLDLWKVDAFRRKWQARTFDGAIAKVYEMYDYEPGCIEQLLMGKRLHPAQPKIMGYMVRQNVVGVMALWRFGTLEFRLWESTLNLDCIIKAIEFSLAVTEDIEAWDGKTHMPFEQWIDRIEVLQTAWSAAI